MFPICRTLKTTHGPHSTCLMTAETFLAAHPLRHSKRFRAVCLAGNFNCCLVVGHRESLLFLGLYLLNCALLSALALCSLLGYAAVRLCLRFQVMLTLWLVMLQRIPVQFNWFNVGCVYFLHVVFVFTGGFGRLVLAYVDT